MRKLAVLAGATLLSLVLTGCGQSSREAPSNAAEAPLADLAIRGYRGTDISIDGNSISAGGGGEGVRGVILSREGAPVLVRFTVRGRQARLRVRQAEDTFDAPLAEERNAIMLGTGGASSAIVFTRREEGPLVVTVASVTDCQLAPEGVCVPMQAPGADAAPAQ